MFKDIEIRREPVGEGATKMLPPSGVMPPAEHLDDDGQRDDVAASDQNAAAASSTPYAPKRRGRRAKAGMIPTRELPDDTHSDGDGHCRRADHEALAASSEPSPVGVIVALARRRSQWKKAAQKLTLQELAICRSLCGGDKVAATKMRAAVLKGDGDVQAEFAIAPLVAARLLIEREVAPVERTLKKLARSLPAYDHVKMVRGFGELRFALIVGETGDLSNYSNPAKVWKRLGLAVMDDGRQRRVAGEAALLHGYNPARRAVVWNLAGEIIKAQGEGRQAEERQFYDIEKAKQLAKGLTPIHAHNRALRHMTKRIVRDLWVAWRRASSSSEPIHSVPAANHSEGTL